MTTYYIGADVHSNSTELAVEKNKKIVVRYKLPASLDSLSISIIPPGRFEMTLHNEEHSFKKEQREAAYGFLETNLY